MVSTDLRPKDLTLTMKSLTTTLVSDSIQPLLFTFKHVCQRVRWPLYIYCIKVSMLILDFSNT